MGDYARPDAVEGGPEGVGICVDVGEDGDAHRILTRP
jgi:hypothetical protein